MEIMLAIIGIVLAFCLLLDKATNFIKQLKTKGTAKLHNGFELKMSVVPVDNKKSEAAHKTHFTNN